MGAILEIILPIFAVMGVGYILAARRVFSGPELKTLGKFIMNVGLPALMFIAVSTNPLTSIFRLDWMGIYALTGAAMIGLSLLVFTPQGLEPQRRAIAAMGTACPNSAYVGFPILLLAFPDIAQKTLAMALIAENFVIVPLSLMLLELSKPRDAGSVLSTALNIFKSVVRRPMIVALLLGLLVSVLGLSLPDGVTRAFDLLANATAGIALFVIGASLYGIKLAGNLSVAAQIAVGKVCVQPLVALGLIALATALGIGALSDEDRAAMLILLATPMFAIFIVFAQEVGHERMASLAMLGATLGSFFVLSAVVYWLV